MKKWNGVPYHKLPVCRCCQIPCSNLFFYSLLSQSVLICLPRLWLFRTHGEQSHSHSLRTGSSVEFKPFANSIYLYFTLSHKFLWHLTWRAWKTSLSGENIGALWNCTKMVSPLFTSLLLEAIAQLCLDRRFRKWCWK